MVHLPKMRTTSLRLWDATLRRKRSRLTRRGLRPSSILLGGGTASGAPSGFIYTFGCLRISYGAIASCRRSPRPSPLTRPPSFTRTQDTYAFGIIAGFAASAWSVFLLVRSIRHGNGVEAWHYTAQFFWLFANAWWMYGELTDWRCVLQPPTFAPSMRLDLMQQVPASIQDTAAASERGRLHDVVCMDLASSLLRRASAHVPVCSLVY